MPQIRAGRDPEKRLCEGGTEFNDRRLNVQASANWVEGLRFIGASGSGHGVIMDGSKTDGPDGSLGPSPMEMLLLGLAGCSGIDVVHILKRMRQDVTDCRVEVAAERSGEEPRVFTTIKAKFTVSGRDLKRDRVEEAVRLSSEKYCSASVMLGKTAKIDHEIVVVEA
jgi:putative redox protein